MQTIIVIKFTDTVDSVYHFTIFLVVEARKSQNLTQKELSKLTGIRQSNLSRIENGKCTPTLEMLQKIAAGLGKRVVIQIL